MIQLVLLGLAVLCVVVAAKALIGGRVSLTRGSELEGSAARGVGIGLLALAAVLAAFALIVLPRL